MSALGIEVKASYTGTSTKDYTADLVITDESRAGSHPILIEISITDPKPYKAQHWHPLRALEQRYEERRKQFETKYNWPMSNYFILLLDTFGNWHPKSLSFAKDICTTIAKSNKPLFTKLWHQFRSTVAVATLSGEANTIKECNRYNLRRRLQPVRQPPPPPTTIISAVVPAATDASPEVDLHNSSRTRQAESAKSRRGRGTQ